MFYDNSMRTSAAKFPPISEARLKYVAELRAANAARNKPTSLKKQKTEGVKEYYVKQGDKMIQYSTLLEAGKAAASHHTTVIIWDGDKRIARPSTFYR